MRNYFDILNTDRFSEDTEKLNRISEVESSLEEDYFVDLKTVLSDREQHMHYKRMHLQYDAISAVLARGTPQKDSNSWSKRVVEFPPAQNKLPD